jgi:hypothetical protein
MFLLRKALKVETLSKDLPRIQGRHTSGAELLELTDSHIFGLHWDNNASRESATINARSRKSMVGNAGTDVNMRSPAWNASKVE